MRNLLTFESLKPRVHVEHNLPILPPSPPWTIQRARKIKIAGALKAFFKETDILEWTAKLDEVVCSAGEITEPWEPR